MRRITAGAAVAWAVITLGGCAAITGLDALQEDNNFDSGGSSSSSGAGSSSGASDAPSDMTTGDTSSSSSGSSSGASSSSSSSGSSSGSSSSSSSSGGDDGASDAPPDVAFDGPACDSGTLGDPDNCGGCGVKCDPLSAKIKGRSCMNNMSCGYTCNSGYTSCPKNGDGCGCSTPNYSNLMCCNGACPLSHQWDENMAGTDFFDCENTYDMQLALDACTAFTGDAKQCGNFVWQCQAPDGGATGELSVCSDGPNAASCRCWSYTNPNQGYTDDLNMKQPNCPCPDPMFGSQPYK